MGYSVAPVQTKNDHTFTKTLTALVLTSYAVKRLSVFFRVVGKNICKVVQEARFGFAGADN